MSMILGPVALLSAAGLSVTPSAQIAASSIVTPPASSTVVRQTQVAGFIIVARAPEPQSLRGNLVPLGISVFLDGLRGTRHPLPVTGGRP
tara:strand:+ start:1352 stop:1621 length:270 start_codon:yes stop_codon:yes gene_type:complete